MFGKSTEEIKAANNELAEQKEFRGKGKNIKLIRETQIQSLIYELQRQNEAQRIAELVQKIDEI